MYQIKKKQGFKKSCLLAVLLFMMCIGFCITAQAAVSTSNIQTASSGKFIKTGSNWTYRYANGKLVKNCLLNIKGKTYYFSPKGYLLYGWQKIQGQYYYFGKVNEGHMYKGCWLRNSKKQKQYYLSKSGVRATGLRTTSKGTTYYFGGNGKLRYGWQTIKGKRYYFGTADQGWMYKSKWLKYGNYYYYLNKNGAANTGWHTTSNGNRYLFSKTGKAYSGEHRIGNTVYYFDKKGRVLRSGPNLSVTSDCAILVDADTGKTIYGKSETTRHANASTTKILTCILALENCGLNDKVTASANAAAQEPTKLYMHAGESFRMKDLLYSLMLPSHNDTAVAIAEHISGSTAEFAALMNKKARAIGCKNTNFVTPNGLDQGLNHYTTAQDLAKITRYALKNATFRKIVSTGSYRFKSLSGSSYSFSTTNELLGKLDGLSGVKTGYTNKAGYCFVGVMEDADGKTYISVTLGGPSSSARWNDTETLLAAIMPGGY